MRYSDAKRLVVLSAEHGVLPRTEDGLILMFRRYTEEVFAEMLKENPANLQNLVSALTAQGAIVDLSDVRQILRLGVQYKLVDQDENNGDIIAAVRMDEDTVANELVDDSKAQALLKAKLEERGVKFVLTS